MTDKSSSFSAIFGVSRESANLVGVAVAAVRSGFAMLPIEPGGKAPRLCALRPAERKAADREVQQAAKAAGKRNWGQVTHPCGIGEAITSEHAAKAVFTKWYERHPELNLAIEVGKSRVIVVDADTEAEVSSFVEYWAKRTNDPQKLTVAPTVHSPGRQDPETGEWVHKDGGHFYFRLPAGVDLSMAAHGDGVKLPGGACAYFKSRAILVPPSVRAEGPYVLGSDIHDAPAFLIQDVLAGLVQRTQKRESQRNRVSDSSDPIEVWSADTPWEELLSSYGWSRPGRYDSCSCEIWTHPWGASSWKSAVAHDPGCDRWDIDPDGHGFLHLWSDNAFPGWANDSGNRNLTKLQFLAESEGTDVRSVVRSLGLSNETTVEDLLPGEECPERIYRTHPCESKHRTFKTWAKCRWSGSLVDGEGEHMVISNCRNRLDFLSHIRLFDAADLAGAVLRQFDVGGCGPACDGDHELGRIER